MRRRVAPAALLALAGCVSGAHPAASTAAATPVFDPVAFFAGRTEGRGVLRIAFHHRQRTLVEGTGTPDGDVAITLAQTVRRGDAAPTRRVWHLHRVAPGRYAGTLSDARGPVTGDVTGDRLHLRFKMKGGLDAQQWLVLLPGGQVAQNTMVITKLGVPVARLDEAITRVGAR